MPDQIFMLANLVIMVAYAAITAAIVVPVARAGQLRTNKLALATAMIFFSCAVGHGLHALMAYRCFTQPPAMPGMRCTVMGSSWTSAWWDLLTAGVGVYYWSLRRRYGLLLSRGAIYVDPWGQQHLDQAAARERAAHDVAEAHRATLATVVEHADEAIIGLTPDGSITAWNAGAERMFGYAAGEVLGRRASMLADPAGADQQTNMLTRIRHGARSLSYEGRRLRRDGTPVELSMAVTAIVDQAGTVIGMSVIARDISAVKEAAERQRAIEDRSQRAQRMESLGKLAGGVAHDFNNIMAIIGNYTDFAIEETPDKPQVQADLNQVRAAADRATNLTRQLLTFTRGDAIQPQDVDLGTSLAEVQGMLERTIGEHITLVTVPARDPVTVNADPGQLHQVLLNLAVNARDAMPDGGTLVMEADTASLDGNEFNIQPPLAAGVYARLVVSDTGEGMSAETAAHIFEPFYTTKPRGSGTGLGLATVYGIVTEAGGGINLYSEAGVGTTFRVYLPLVARTASTSDTVTSQPPPRGDGRTILVVEDEIALARVLTRILTKYGYKVLTATSGAAALNLFDEHGCDLLLTDVIMPEMSGTRLAELLTAKRPDLSVIYMSGYSNGLLGSTHVIDGDIAFIEKPFTAGGLLRKLAAVHEKARS